MTDRAEKKASTKTRLVFASILALVTCTCIWVAYFLVNFNLNDYRQQVEDNLSAHFSLPVKIGGIHYNLHDTNLALHLAALQIGDEKSQLQLIAPEVLIDLQWRGLLQRSFKFTRVMLSDPELSVRRAVRITEGQPESTAETTPVLIDQDLLHSMSIDEFEISGGTFHYEQTAPGTVSRQTRIDAVTGNITNVRLNNTAQLDLKGKLKLPGQKRHSPLRLKGNAALNIDESTGLSPEFDIGIQGQELDLEAIAGTLKDFINMPSVSGETELDLHLKADSLEQVDFQLKLPSKGVNIRPENNYSSPIQFKDLYISGRLLRNRQALGIADLAIQIDDSRLSGNLEWTTGQAALRISAEIANSQLTVAQIKQWLPDLDGAWKKIDQNLGQQGTLFFQSGQLTYFRDETSQNRLEIAQLQGELQQISWPLKNAPAVEIRSLPFSINREKWQIVNSQWQMGSLEVLINGHGEYSADRFHVTSLDFAGEVMPERLTGEWLIPKGALTTEGKIAVKGHLEGPHDQLAIDLQADLSHLSLNHPAGLRLSPDPEDQLNVHATVSPEKISIDHGSVKWSAAKGLLTGSYSPGDESSLNVDALLSINDLTRIAESLPLLEKIKLHGQADLSISQQGFTSKHQPEMTLTLRDAGLIATRHIADLNNINGRVKVTPNGLQADHLRLQLGESLFTVNAELADFTNPRLSLDVKAPAVRANDVIFHSASALLRDIEGHLDIDRNGLTFAPVNVRLDGGTEASVNGTIDFKPPYKIQLDITSDFAQIGEVIALWKDRSESSEIKPDNKDRGPEKPRTSVPITILAQVKSGDLYGMKFHDATGVIKPSRERLSIHPLDFSVGEGYFNAQVLTDFSTGQPAFLRVSGHAEDVDALEVYRELLNQKSIVRGKLRGDFYLQGDIGSNYLPSSYGRFNVQIRDGVLHEFPILSKVFSLLNVSQIFALQLPDMDLEGMPYNNLMGNFELKNGILKSEDLAIQSEAMNQLYSGQLDLNNKEINMNVAIHPFGTIDKIVTRIPIAGWLLTGEDEALLTAHFTAQGKTDNVSVQLMPLDTISEPTLGLLKRTLQLPFKLVEDPQILWGGQSKTPQEEISE